MSFTETQIGIFGSASEAPADYYYGGTGGVFGLEWGSAPSRCVRHFEGRGIKQSGMPVLDDSLWFDVRIAKRYHGTLVCHFVKGKLCAVVVAPGVRAPRAFDVGTFLHQEPVEKAIVRGPTEPYRKWTWQTKLGYRVVISVTKYDMADFAFECDSDLSRIGAPEHALDTGNDAEDDAEDFDFDEDEL